MKTLVFTGGGTLGHCIPNLALLPYLKDGFDRFYYIGSHNGPEMSAVAGTMEYMSISTAKLVRSFDLNNLLIPFRLFKGVRQAKKILKSVRADVVFSKGGFVSVPVVVAASALGIPVVSHESDLTLGLANRLTHAKCKFVLTSFSLTARKLNNGIYTGPPIRDEILSDKRAQAEKKFFLSGTKPVLLIIGGSSGAKKINDFIFENVDEILKKYEIVHICGDKHTNGLKRKGYYQSGFEKDMALIYSACDMAISRCGSNTAFELFVRAIPTLFIPLSKKSSRGDQIDNACYFENKGLSLTLTEENMRIRELIDKLEYLNENRAAYIKRMRALDLKSANKRIADIIKYNCI